MSLSLSEGQYLNRFAGLDPDSTESTDIDLDYDLNNSVNLPPVGQIQNSKSVLRGGPVPSESTSSRKRRERGFRSKLAEEQYKLAHMVFDGDIRVRVMDVDRFDLGELHEYFMYTLVRRFPSEDCMRVASRIAVFRDKNSQHSFESLSRDMAALFGPTHGPELTALFARCYGTIPVPFMLDYIRRFGKFSRKFIAQEVEKTIVPRPFDFVRYEGGAKPLPGFVARPFALRSFARMLPPCAAKRYIFQHLLARSPDHGEAFASKYFIDSNVPLVARIGDRVAQSRNLQAVEADVHARQPVAADDIIANIEKGPMSKEEGPYASQFTRVQIFNNHSDVAVRDELEVDDSVDPSGWWKDGERFGQFFRYNKKAYRLDQDGWRQVEDSRGVPLDYAKERDLKRGAKRVKNQYARKTRQTNRNNLIKRLIANRLRKSD